jgi:hypothetical protein
MAGVIGKIGFQNTGKNGGILAGTGEDIAEYKAKLPIVPDR